MKTPHLYQVSDLVDCTNAVRTLHPEAGWIPMRPVGFQGLALKRRLKLAWGVFAGKYDAVYWEPRLRDVWKCEDNTDLDARLAQATEAAKGLSKVDLRDKLPPVQDQGGLNSAAALSASTVGVPYMYYNERAIDKHN